MALNDPGGARGAGSKHANTVCFDVRGVGDLRRRCRRLQPDRRSVCRAIDLHSVGGAHARLADRLRALLASSARRPDPATVLWFWPQDEASFRAQARDVLLRFVHPLIATGQPFCVGLPFGAEVLAPAPLGPADRDRLDLEDIGLLLTSHGDAGRAPGGRTGQSLDHLAALDASQRNAAQHGAGAARVLAPAGAGKTKTLVARVLELVARGVDPGQILVLAFNTLAAEQLEERLEAHGVPCTRRIDLSRSGAAVHCATFNAFGVRYQRACLNRRVSVDTGGSRALMKQALAEAGFGLAQLQPARGTDPIGAILEFLGRVRAGLEAPERIHVPLLSSGEQPVVTVPFGKVHEAYSRLQMAHGRQSFDDQIYFAVVDMLATPRHRRLIQQRYDHILVDEFQDLNPAQLTLVDILSRPYRNLFAVGDDDQLIYGWRFADPEGILGFHDRVPSPPHSATHVLGTNYRCARGIVAAAARLVEHNERREPKTMNARASAPEGSVLFAAAETWRERGELMCGFLRDEKTRLACGWRDLAVLTRFRFQQFAVSLALDSARIPRPPCSGHRLFTHSAARLARSCLAVAMPNARASGEHVVRVAATLVPGLPRPQLAAVETSPHPWKRLARIGSANARTNHELRAFLDRAISLQRDLDRQWETGPAPRCGLTALELLKAVILGFALEEFWCLTQGFALETPSEDSDRHGGGPDPHGPQQVLDALAVLAETYPEPHAFLASWDDLAARELAGFPASEALPRQRSADVIQDGAADRIAVSTIHAAKGREYRAVVIPDYFCDISHWSAAEIEEERRVLYVGVTRACDSLLFTVDPKRAVHPFLRELVQPPREAEADELLLRLEQASEEAELARLRARLAELEILFPPTRSSDAASSS